MKNTLFLFSLLFAGLTLTQCATQVVYPKGNNYAKNAAPSYKKSQPFFIYGIGQSQEKRAYDVCGKGNVPAKVVTKTTFTDGLLGTLTFGIFTPRTLEVYCD